MIGDDEIVFAGKYKDFNFGVRFNLAKAEKNDVIAALLYVSENIEAAGFKFSGIDYAVVDKAAKKCGSVAEVVAHINATSTRKLLATAVKERKLMATAESCFFNLLLTRAGIAIKPKLQLTLKPEKYEEKGRIGFIGKYKEWTAIKKLGLAEVEHDWEVAGVLASVNMTAINKVLRLAADDYAAVEQKAKAAAAGKRKSFAGAAEVIEATAGDAVLLTKALEALGYYTYLTPFTLMKMYPDLKPKKPKGRAPKG
ncbi:MAG: DUF2666 family protein [Candidatus Micrarchaeota archaeon]